MMAVLASYQALLELSEEMALLATQQAWDKLAELEAQRVVLIASLPARLDNLPDVEQKTIVGVIQQILLCDETMQEHIGPWCEHVGTLIARLQPKLNNAA